MIKTVWNAIKMLMLQNPLGGGLPVPYRTVPYRTLPYPTVPYRTVPYPTLPYLTLPYMLH